MSADGSKDKLTGKIHEGLGKIKNDDSEKLKGKAKQSWGDVKDKVKDAKDDVAGKINKEVDKHKKN
ncbi:CsbD family protein [Bombilactobacillus thymidiniphilus]